MEKRPYFLFGDVSANVLSGAIVMVVCRWVVPEGWPMVPGMVAGMLLGMLLSLPLSMAFVPFFGAMEVMMPVMLTGMVAGMAGGMAPVELDAGRLMLGGALLGLGALLASYGLDGIVSGRVKRWTA